MVQVPPKEFCHLMADLKEKFIKNFKGTCRRATTIVDLENCVQKEGESTLSWARPAAEIIHFSHTINAQTAVIVLERIASLIPKYTNLADSRERSRIWENSWTQLSSMLSLRKPR